MTTELSQQMKRSGFRSLVGYKTRKWAENYGEVEVTIDERHMNGLGIVHGGVYAALLDAGFGHAANWCSVEGNWRKSVTLSLSTQYLSSARSGTLVCKARVDGQDGRMCTLSGEVFDDKGTLCALGQATFMYMPGSECVEGEPRPKKG
jgi:uncharacterized protein (TIGR00369 family)